MSTLVRRAIRRMLQVGPACDRRSCPILGGRRSPKSLWTVIGIGGHLAMSPLPHHRAYGSVPRRFGRLSRHRGSR
jgi:hypothetical protein